MSTLSQKVNLADVLKVGIFVVGLAGTWYSMKYEVEWLSAKVEKLERELHDTNLGVIKNDITYIKEELKDLHDHFENKNSRKNSKAQNK
jgi:hypothetical protein